MQNYKFIIIWGLLGGTASINCDLPNKPKDPNFTTSNIVEVPLLAEQRIQLLGDGNNSDVLIDTTSAEFDSLFAITQGGTNDGLISIAVEEDFDFGDLNDVIPSISIDPTSFSSEVGEIGLGSFSSGSGNLGTASFQALTGFNPSSVPAGTPIVAGTTPSPVKIDVGAKTDFFVSATIKSGALKISITNNLGFDIQNINITLKSGSIKIGSTTLSNVNHGITTSNQITFNEGDKLENLNIDVSVSWNAQTTQALPGALVVEEIEGVGLKASAVEAAVEAIDFSTNSTTTSDTTEFKFTSDAHYVELASGEISIAPIVNGLDLTIDSLLISFPGIRKAPWGEADSLVISYTGADKILRSSQSIAQNIDLTGYRIYANNNTVNFNIFALTENTQKAVAGKQTRVISENQSISSRVTISNLKISTATGEIATQKTILGSDDASNNTSNLQIIDLYNDTEVSLTEIDGLADLSSEIDGIEFSEASLSINYESNIGVPTTIYMAMLGIDGDDQEIFLSGLAGSDKEVKSNDPIAGIYSNGLQLDASKLIKFVLTPSKDGNSIVSAVEFNDANSTVSKFLNALPKEIRFIGIGVVNETGGEATISTPLEFDPSIVVDLPLYFSTDSASIEIKEDGSGLSELPDEESDTKISEAQLYVGYTNGLPLGFDIEIEFLDDQGKIITQLPLAGDTPIELNAASINDTTRFATSAANDNLIISLTEDQFLKINKTDSVAINASLNTYTKQAVKLKSDDSISLSVSAKFVIQQKIN